MDNTEQEAKRKSMARVIAKLERIHNETRFVLTAFGADTSHMGNIDAVIADLKKEVGPEYPPGGIVTETPADADAEYIVKRTGYLNAKYKELIKQVQSKEADKE